MQRSTAIILSTLCLVYPTSIVAQDKTGFIPPRYQTLAKEGRVRLKGILGAPEMHPAYSPTTRFTADGKRAIYVEDLTTGGHEKPSYRSRLSIWDVEAKGWPREIDVDGKNVSALDLSRNGAKALLSGLMFPEKEKYAQAYLSLWDLKIGKEIRTIATEERAVLTVALAADETVALVGTQEDLKLWDLKSGKPVLSFAIDKKIGATAVAWLPGGKQFLAGFHGGEIRLYDRDKEKHLRSYKTRGDHAFIWHLAISKDGKRFVAGDFQSSATLWETGGKEINSLRIEKRTIEEVITSIALADDGKTVLSTWSKSSPEADDSACTRLICWDGEANKTLWSHTTSYRGRLPVHIDGDNLHIGGGPNLFSSWSIQRGKASHHWDGHKGPINAVGVLANNDIISVGQEGQILTWRKGQVAKTMFAHKGAVTALALSKDRNNWLTAGADLEIRHWPPDALRPIVMKKSHMGPITSLAYGVSGSGDRTVRTWDLMKGQEIATFAGHAEGVNAVAVSPDDRWLASGSDDATIKVWPIKDGKLDPDREPLTLEKHTKPVTSLTFTPDGKRLISGSQDQKLMVWNLQKMSMDFMIPGHKNWINSVLLLDARTVVTASDDLTVAVWNLETGMEIGRVDFGIVGDCPRCLAQVGPDRFLIGTASWLIYEVQLLPEGKSKRHAGSSIK